VSVREPCEHSGLPSAEDGRSQSLANQSPRRSWVEGRRTHTRAKVGDLDHDAVAGVGDGLAGAVRLEGQLVAGAASGTGASAGAHAEEVLRRRGGVAGRGVVTAGGGGRVAVAGAYEQEASGVSRGWVLSLTVRIGDSAVPKLSPAPYSVKEALRAEAPMAIKAEAKRVWESMLMSVRGGVCVKERLVRSSQSNSVCRSIVKECLMMGRKDLQSAARRVVFYVKMAPLPQTICDSRCRVGTVWERIARHEVDCNDGGDGSWKRCIMSTICAVDKRPPMRAMLRVAR